MTQRTRIALQVQDFMKMAGQKIRKTPDIGLDKDVRLSAHLVMEEAFEFLDACYGDAEIQEIYAQVRELIDKKTPYVHLPKAIDALADLDYVSEGARQRFGVNGLPIADEVHRANMAKLKGPVDPVTGKKLKPPGWTPPDIEGELHKQGW